MTFEVWLRTRAKRPAASPTQSLKLRLLDCAGLPSINNLADLRVANVWGFGPNIVVTVWEEYLAALRRDRRYPGRRHHPDDPGSPLEAARGALGQRRATPSLPRVSITEK